MKYMVHSLEDLQKIATSFIATLRKQDTAAIVALRGDLGSGKTTFTQICAKLLGIEEQITSPTFVIEKIYPLRDQVFTHFIHIDAYRLESGQELQKLGFENIRTDSNNCIFIEWPEKIADLDITYTHTIFFQFIDETTREIEVQ